MRRGLRKILIVAGIGAGLYLPKVFADNSENDNVEKFECASCHGGTAPNLPADQAFNVLDPDTGLQVTRYQPGKTYTIRIRFNNPSPTSPWRNAYVLHIADIATGEALRGGTIISSGGIGVVTDTGPTNPQTNSRIITSTTKVAVDNPEISWQAPSSGKIRFQLSRMESNNNGGQGGDRVSQTLEQTILLAEGATNDSSDDDASTSDDDSSITGSSADGFGTNLVAGCGSIQQPKTSSSTELLFTLILMVGLVALRRRHALKD